MADNLKAMYSVRYITGDVRIGAGYGVRGMRTNNVLQVLQFSGFAVLEVLTTRTHG
jgi:hypothetical protein